MTQVLIDALPDDARMNACCHFGQTCGLCDCGRSDQTAEQRREWDAHQLDRARAVLALIPPRRNHPH